MRIAGADKAVGNVLAWALREEWADEWGAVLTDHLVPACDDLDIDVDELETILGQGAYDVVVACAVEDFFTRRYGDEQDNVIDAYLQRRGWRESGSGRTYLRALRDSVIGLYEVVDLAPGNHLVVRDLIRGGEPVRVNERMGSQTAARWDRLALRLLSIGGTPCLAGGVLLYSHEAAAVLLKAIERGARQERSAAKRRAKRAGHADDIPLDRIKAEFLPDLAPLFTRTWLLSMLGQPSGLPHMVNFDGHDLVLTEIRYSLQPGAATEIERRLDAAPLIERDGENETGWTWLRGEMRPAVAPNQGDTPALAYDTDGEDGRWTFAHIELNLEGLLVICNSVERAEIAKAMLTDLLGVLVGTPLTAMQTVEQAMAEHDETDDASEAVPPEIAGPLLQQLMDDHYRKCLNQPIGMLDGKTARQAVRSKKGREQVVAWLKYLENGAARQARDDPSAAYDFTWMWEELGLADRRR